MIVSVRYLAQFKLAAGTPAEQVELPGPCTVAELVVLVAGRRPGLRTVLLDESSRVQRTVLMFLGDEQVGPERVLREGDELTLLTPIAGGGGCVMDGEERALYEWQLSVPGFGEAGQQRLRGAGVLVSRVGGVGGAVAQQLAVAGVGRLVLAHAGNLRPDDLNRQVLMSHTGLGQPRVLQAAGRLRELNPYALVEAVAENVGAGNVERLVGGVDLVVSCAPVFAERLLLNREAVRQGKPLIDCAMYELEAQLTVVLPGRTACLACLYPEPPPAWRRQFPVFGAVAGAVGCLGAMEAIKVLAGLGEPLAGRMLLADLRDMSFRKVGLRRRPDCPVCGQGAA